MKFMILECWSRDVFSILSQSDGNATIPLKKAYEMIFFQHVSDTIIDKRRVLMRSISELKQASKQAIEPQKWEAIIAVLIVYAVIGVLSAAGIGIIIAGPMIVGLIYYITSIRKGDKPVYNTLLDGFKEPLTSSIVTFLLQNIFIILWSLLLIIPGIIKSFSYAMSLYIISDHPNMSATDAITLSSKMMDGHKMELFMLYLSYIGWYLLGVITFGLAILYIAPFVKAAELEFYLELKANQ